MHKVCVLGFVDIVGNLLILLKENDIEVNKISFSLVDKFEYILEGEFFNNGYDLYVLNDKKKISDFFDWYGEYFKSLIHNTISIVKEPSLEYLYEQFRSSIPKDLLCVFDDKSLIVEVLQAYKEEFEAEYKDTSEKEYKENIERIKAEYKEKLKLFKEEYNETIEKKHNEKLKTINNKILKLVMSESDEYKI